MTTVIHLGLLAALFISIAVSSKQYHIVPVNSTILCQRYPKGTCFTLDQLSSHVHDTKNVTISFLPGEHLLTWNMKFNRAGEITLKSEHPEESNHPRISCVTNKHIKVTRTKLFTLQGLNISGCWNNQSSGGVLSAANSNMSILDCIFINNTARRDGGALSLENCRTRIENSTFSKNSGRYGGALSLKNCQTRIEKSTFSKNSGQYGGALYATGVESYTNISYTLFEDNHAHHKGSGIYGKKSMIHARCSKFNRNAIFLKKSSLNSSMNFYTNNTRGGAVGTESSSASMFDKDIFTGNKGVKSIGAAISSFKGNVNISNCCFMNNGKIHYSRGVVVSVNGDISFSGSNNFSNNTIPAFTSYNSDVCFMGKTIFFNNTTTKKGGAIFSTSSVLHYKQRSNTVIRGNTAEYGGGMYLEQSMLRVSGEMLITGNTGKIAGGGLYGLQTDIYVQNKLNISSNIAKKNGGGIYFSGGSCEIQSGIILVSSNRANHYGGGIFMEQNSKITLLKNITHANIFLNISQNSALRGGGIYILQDNKAICGSKKESNSSLYMCSIQTIRYFIYYNGPTKNHLTNIFFNNNSAVENGIDIFGGLLDRCTINPRAEILFTKHFFQYKHYNGVRYLLAIANFNWETQQNFIFDKPDSLVYSDLYNYISSDPVRLCFCDNGTIDCTSHKTVFKKKGEMFTLSLVAVDQVGKPVNATLISSLQTENGGIGRLKEGQQTRHIEAQCTELEYNVYASGNETVLKLYTDGPCEDQGISRKEVNISFQPCTCPTGLSQQPFPINCSCDCDKEIAQYVSKCSSENGEIRINSSVWINYVNASPSGFVIQQCSFDYCKERPVDIGLASQREADQQCAFNRTGRMCGQCEQGLSLVFASSRCQQCSNYYLFLLLPFALAGIALVAFILLLNMTVATGTIYGLIFYANTLAANRPIFLPFETPNFLTVFISWLNLDLGIETCFYNGMSSYGKFLLQLVFPAYVFLLIAIIIILCNCSQRIANLLGKKNPEATLYTLVFLSYSKLIRMIITALQFEIIYYPGTTKIIWLYDANIPYLAPSHIPRFIAAFIIMILGAVYTTLLLFGQVFNYCSEHRLMKWTTHRYYIHFTKAHYAPFSEKHYYWVGLLLLVRLVHYLISAFANDSVVILSIGVLTSLLLAHKLLSRQIYSKQLLDNLDSSFLLNITILSISTFYITNVYKHSREVGESHQQTLAIVSMSISFISFLGIVLYHTLDSCGVKLGELPNKVLTKLREHHHYQPVAVVEGQSEDEELLVLLDETQNYADTDQSVNDRNDPAHYITPPIIRSAVPADQLREPALDDLIPVQPEDYNIPPTPRPQHREPTFTEINIHDYHCN